MMQFVKVALASALLAGGAAIAVAQTTNSDSPSKAEAGAPTQGPGSQAPSTGTGSRPLGPPATEQVAPGKNPTGESVEKKKSDSNDPRSGGVPPMTK